MADITKCLSLTCPIKEKCYRFTALSDEYWQSVANFQYEIIEGKVICDYFWDNKVYIKRKNND